MATEAKNQLVAVPFITIAPRDGVVEQLPKALRPNYEAIVKIFHEADALVTSARVNLMKRYYKVGKEVARAHKAAQKRKSGSGPEALKELSKALGINPRTLYDAMQVAEGVSEEDFEGLVVHPAITWNHVTSLCAIDHADVREELKHSIIKKGWSVRDLITEIRVLAGNKKRRGPGRPPGVPRNIPHAVEKLLKGSKQYHHSLGDGLFGEQYDVVHKIIHAQHVTLTKALCDQLDETIDEVKAIQGTLPGRLESLEEAKQHIADVLAGKFNPPEEEDKDLVADKG